MIRLVIMDMAGTAVNENNTVYKTVQKSIADSGYTVTLEEVLTHGAGKEKRVAIQDVLIAIGEEVSQEEVDKIHYDFRQMLSQAYKAADITLFEGVKSILPHLRKQDIKVAFNTGYKREMALYLIEKIGIEVGNDIDCLAASDDVSRGRPYPDMINLICEKLNIPADQAVKIGDSRIDIEEGKQAGVSLTIGVTTGAQTRAELQEATPDHIIDDMQELMTIIEDVNQG